jgi:phage terminase large subunit
MSTEYDIVYVQEATELNEHDWELLITRLRGRALEYTQIIGDCNPAGPNHWIIKRTQTGKMRMVNTFHRNNPLLWDIDTKQWTNFGKAYLSKLEALTGVRRSRLLEGKWVQSEGVVYDEFDWNVHVIDRFEIPPQWRRLWGIDFGFTHPFVWAAWAEDPESGTLYRFAELYATGLRNEEVADKVIAWMSRTNERFPEAIICDHDAEGRATLQSRWKVPTVAADKAVSMGIQAVKSRLAGNDGGIRFLLNSNIESYDSVLVDAKRPVATEQEMEMYVWKNGIRDSEPVKENDHGMDMVRYVVMYVDGGRKRQWSIAEIEAFGHGEILAQPGERTLSQQHEIALAEVGHEDGEWQEQWRVEVARKQQEMYNKLLGRQ